MPTYEYMCESCGGMVTVILSVHDQKEPVECQTCKVYMVRVWNTPGVIFKGGGWGGQ